MGRSGITNEITKNVMNPILYFKHLGKEDSKTNLSKDDFSIMTNFQAEMLLLFGNNKICIDGTHGLNSNNIYLYTLLVVVVDEYDNSITRRF